jgi:SpoVK/Ycf46/Vps4 family AAA+-type ATPase
MQTATLPPQGMGGFGMNQMLEMFKMQYLMKFLDGGNQVRGGGSLTTMFVLLGYDQLVKYFPGLIQLVWAWIMVKLYGKVTEKDKREPLLLPATQPPPATKSIKAFIQFERHPDKASDPRIDAVIYHVCNLPDVRSLRYNGVEMIPNFKDTLMIENDIWFEIINPNTASMPFSSGSGGVKEGKQEPILYRLSTYDHDITWLHKFVDQTIDRYEQEKKNKLGSETYYFDQLATSSDIHRSPYGSKITMFTKSKFTSNRTLNNVYLRQIEELKQRVEFFIRRRDWYDSKGIPHTLGIVMYGVPGCGKTSTIKGIANETKRHIFNISLSEIKTKESLKDLFYNEQVHILQDGKTEVLTIPLKHRLYVIEDIDAMESVVIKRSAEQLKREEEKKLKLEAEMEILKQTQGQAMALSMMGGKKDDDKDKLDLATLLNVLDGVRETPGRIIVLSTNYPERLDEALLRPGRFDMMLEFEKHSCAVLQQHIEKHYDIQLNAKQLKDVYNSKLEKKWTPAEVSQVLFRRIGDVDGAIRDLLYEDPAKLFKFSQQKTDAEKEAEKSVAEKPVENPAPEEFSGTQLENLLEDSGNSATEDSGNSATEKPVENPADNSLVEGAEKPIENSETENAEKTVEKERILLKGAEITPKVMFDRDAESSDTDSTASWTDIHFSGGSTMFPDYPTKEQIEAEKNVRPVLFSETEKIQQEISKLREQARIEELKLLSIDPDTKNINFFMEDNALKNLSAEKKLGYEKLRKEYNEKELNLRILLMLKSPMFNNDDGYTAMNDCGLSCAPNGVFPPSVEKFDIPAANSYAEKTLDDFFPEPLDVPQG